jgi:putative hydrolase of the HAD superfamily
LFGTIVFFDPDRLPRRSIAGMDRVVTVTGIDELLAAVAPGVTLAAFLEAVTDASASIGREKQADFREVPTAERYARALSALGARDGVASVAALMAQRHMASLAGAVVCPPGRAALIRALASRYPLALVSNFDHGDAARRLLDRFGLSSSFGSIRISAEVGVMKPAAEIFLAACRDLEVVPADAVHVGDSMTADVKGANDAGLRALWIGSGPADGAMGSVADLADLPRWLSDRYG